MAPLHAIPSAGEQVRPRVGLLHEAGGAAAPLWLRQHDAHDVCAREPGAGGPDEQDVTESARAHTYYFSKQVQKTCEFRMFLCSKQLAVEIWLLTAPSPLS